MQIWQTMKNELIRTPSHLLHYHCQSHSAKRQHHNTDKGRYNDRTGCEILVIAKLNGKHRGDGGAGAGLKQQHDLGHHALHT